MSEFEKALNNSKEYGVIERVTFPLCYVSGLPKAKIDDMVIFEDDSVGRVLGLRSDIVEIVSFSKNPPIVSQKVTNADKTFKFPVGEDFLGKAVDPLGNNLFRDSNIEIKDYFPLDRVPDPISSRIQIHEQFITGISIIDSLVPLGKGQRELVLGDRKTGKSSIFIPVIISAIKQNLVVVYCQIGKRYSELKKIKKTLEDLQVSDKVCLIYSNSSDNPALTELTPFSGIALCEYLKSKGISSLLILDDLSNHAKVHREISLTAKRFPGRDAYPGDVFYKHSKLLERGGNFTINGAEVSITVMPVAETYEGGLTGYITSNLIGITDGHLLFDSKMFNRGIRPALDIFLSVTRVGKQTQSPLSRSITYELTAYLATYEKALEFSHFGSELSIELKKVLVIGENLYKLFEQGVYEAISVNMQFFLIGLFWTNILNITKSQDVKTTKSKSLEKYQKDKNFKSFVDEIIKMSKTADELRKNIEGKKDQITNFYA